MQIKNRYGANVSPYRTPVTMSKSQCHHQVSTSLFPCYLKECNSGNSFFGRSYVISIYYILSLYGIKCFGKV